MYLNTLKPAEGSKKSGKRLGRGIGSGKGKTCGKGHKGQKSRSGGFTKVGFEGGQMPIQRRLPKSGFSSRIGQYTAEVRLSDLNKAGAEVVDLDLLRKLNIVNKNIKRAKVISSGSIEKVVTVKGLRVTAGARKLIEAAGGKVEE